MRSRSSTRTERMDPITRKSQIFFIHLSSTTISLFTSSPMAAQYVTLQTSMGDIVLELYTEHAPKTCKNFLELSKRGYYNNQIFHRIISDFMIQGGDPTGTGRGGTSIYGEKFADEIHPHLRFVGAGILAMANSGPNSNGSQFFLTLAPTPFLDGKHTIFGRVSSGMKVVQRLGAVRTDAHDKPLQEVKIFKAFETPQSE